MAAVLLAALAAAAWLVSTEAGLRYAVAFVSSIGPVTIRLDGARGRLMGPLRIDVIEVEHPQAKVAVGICS